MDNLETLPPTTPSRSRGRLLVWILLILLIVAAGVAGFFMLKQNKNKPLEEAKQKIPQNLLLNTQEQQVYQPTQTENSVIRKGEVTANGVEYTVNMPLFEAKNKVLGELVSNHWAVVGNLTEARDNLAMRVAAGEKMLYIQLKSASENQTKVIIVPIVKQ